MYLHVNQKIGYLLLKESYLKQNKNQQRRYWKCLCICGKIIQRREDYLKRAIIIKDRIISCNCMHPNKRKLSKFTNISFTKQPNLNFAGMKKNI